MASEKTMKKRIRQSLKRQKGGIITLPFIIANEAIEKVPSYALIPTLTLYLKSNYHMNIVAVTNLLNIWQAGSNFAPLMGAFIADSYIGRYASIGFGSIFSFLGVVIIWLTTMLPQVRPPPCDPSIPQSCKGATTWQMAILIIALFFKAIGAGGIRPCSMPFGMDQLSNKSEKVLESYFSWYFFAACFGGVLGLTVVVYVMQIYGWKVGYGVSAFLMLVATLAFYMASSLYVKRKPNTSLFTGFAQVISAAYKKRKLPFPSQNSGYYRGKDSEIKVLSDKLKFMNKACIIQNAEEEIGEDGLPLNPWRVCMVQKVEELKAIFKVIPIWSTGIMIGIALNQHSFTVLQAHSMNRHIFGSFEIPAASMKVFIIGTMVVWLPFYNRVIIPLASRIKGKQVYLSVHLRMGIGLFLSIISMALTAIVESMRRSQAIREGHLKHPTATVNMSVVWLFPQYIVMGVAESFNVIAQFEFYHREFPKTMSSIGNSLYSLQLSVANLLSSVLFNIVEETTSRGGKPSWIADNLNEARFDNYNWLLAGLSVVNMFYYISCCRSYGPPAEVVDEGYISEEDD